MVHPSNKVNNRLFLQLQQVSFRKYQAPLFRNLNWEIQEGETWAITGPSGSGKTLLAEALAGRYRLLAGKILYHFLPEPENIWELPKYVALISFQPQASTLNYGHYYYQQRYNSSDTEGIITVAEFLQNATSLTPQHPTWSTIIQQLHLEDLLGLAVIKLSNGQTRKMLIARALLLQPRLLLLDNPFAGLDKEARQDFKKVIQNLAKGGTEIILVANQTDIPESVTHILALDNFAIKGIFTREEYFGQMPKTELPEPTQEPAGKPGIFLNILPASDFKIAIKFENATISYDGKKILDQVNWTVEKGEKWALLGPNGSGKTTLLSLINGDNPQAFANKIILFDRRKGSGESIWEIKKRIGFISPELHLYFRQNLTAEAVAATGFSDTVYPKKTLVGEEENALTNLFDYYDLAARRKTGFQQLSAGEQRLVLIIRSLVKNPPLLIWDEPFQGLSEALIRKTQALLTAYASPEKTVILVSHYDQEIPVWINKRLYLEEGRVKEIRV